MMENKGRIEKLKEKIVVFLHVCLIQGIENVYNFSLFNWEKKKIKEIHNNFVLICYISII
jgi:hypothetical protein